MNRTDKEKRRRVKERDDEVRGEGKRGEEEQSSSWQVSGVTKDHLSIRVLSPHTHTHVLTCYIKLSCLDRAVHFPSSDFI